jgi:parvulin-like peptidyl-prolyl isomerase
MGKFAALRYELSDRVGMQTSSAGKKPVSKGDETVAEIGPEKITKSDLDRWIDLQIDRQLSLMSPYLSDDKLKIQKESLLKQLSSSSHSQMILNQLVLEEILYRKAREAKLLDDPKIQAEIKKQEHALLAKKMIEKEFADKINITDGDLKTYYEAHKKEYMSHATAKISHILVPNKEIADKVRKQLKKNMSFAEAAKKFSIDSPTSREGGRIAKLVENNKNAYIPGIGYSDDALKLIFSTQEDQIAENELTTDKGVHIIKVREKKKPRQKTFEEVRNEIFRTLRAEKEREVQQDLFRELKEKYDVVIHQSAFTQNKTGKEKDSVTGNPSAKKAAAKK